VRSGLRLSLAGNVGDRASPTFGPQSPCTSAPCALGGLVFALDVQGTWLRLLWWRGL